MHSDLYPSVKIPNLCQEFQIGFYRFLSFAPILASPQVHNARASFLSLVQNSRAHFACSRAGFARAKLLLAHAKLTE
jgi:hypothetical protein